ncbi:glycoside hydrolase family 43 protein [uncultured Paraglaciecola sp.]|uniref:glycoside hydrolase family 43 protein n=1 Tax=uncultured Paraglaciecola sp. TaxID=1765024 RepID=UPI0030DB1EBF
MHTRYLSILAFGAVMLSGCTEQAHKNETTTDTPSVSEVSTIQASGQQEKHIGLDEYKSKSLPLVTNIYTADPSAHVFDGKLYIYPSHDYEAGIPQNDNGDHFAMRDYHILSMDEVGAEVAEHGVALSVDDVPWAGRQMWAPDAASKDGQYYLYFPLKDKQDIFRIGVAISDSPVGPFKPQPEPMAGSFSMDPAVFEDDDQQHYLFFGGIWGGQLQHWTKGEYSSQDDYPADDAPALMPKAVKLAADMVSMDGEPQDIMILDESGQPIKQGDLDRRFFEAAWVHKYQDHYYLSYSTGDTHKIVYAMSENLMGPYIYKGVVLDPVVGWTNHHSIAQFQGKWYLFYHDSTLSKGQTHLRSVKMAELKYNQDGTIVPYQAYY